MRIKLRRLLVMAALLGGINRGAAQLPVITSFSQNGLLVCSNLLPGSVASVQWASSLSGPWLTNWAGLGAVTADSNGLIQVSVPMFYRVLGIAQTTNSTPPASNGMALIPAGSFTMGDTLDDEYDAMPMSINVSAFYMDTNLVSYSQWQAVYAYGTSQGYAFNYVGSGKAANEPVQTVTWYDAVKWSNARSQQAGLTPVYYTDEALTQVYTSGETDDVYPNWSANGFRLPTEAEWEKAARGGLSGKRFPWGNTIAESQANYQGDTTAYTYDLGPNGYNTLYDSGGYPYTSPVGSFAANGYGLYDMAGNIMEWCWDWYGTPYGQPTTNNPTGPASPPGGQTYRVYRGGSWGDVALSLRCASRNYNGSFGPSGADYYYGFRCVMGF
jgi:formylglycine-generating enzyme required for sulfatase activity